MVSKRAYSGLLVLFFTFCAVSADDAVIKSSLTFVIDDTASMWDEVNQVKEEVNIMFEKVLSSKASQIENFVIVTFNDPDAQPRTVTKNREEFRSALAAITPNSDHNYDCAEAAMEGISLALRTSMPHSYLYVFTDASAKDYAKFEQVKSLSQKMQSQIVFLLTGECSGSGRVGPDYQVYHQLADATSGQVFNMMKDDVKDILKYIEESITGIGTKIVDKKISPGYDKTLTYTVDTHTGDTLIAVTGDKPKIGDVIGPGGSRPDTTHIVSGKSEMAVVKVTGAKPGDHVVSVGSLSETHAVVSVKSTINFQLGFNVFPPKSSKDIVTRPPPKGNVFMGVKLLGTGVKLETVQILGMKNEVIQKLKLKLLDEKTQFYVTPSFNPPTTMFRVTINGYDINSTMPVTRTSPTPISRQDLSTDSEVKVDTAPKVTIDGDTSVTLYVDDPLELTCKVHAYPEPEIIWEDRDFGTVMPAETNMVEVPYDYVSVLKIDKANRNTTYQCKANNRNGNDVQGVEIIAKRRFYFDVIDSPKDIRIEYAKEGKLVCKIDASPSATINWYKDAKPLSSSSHIEISKDQSVVTLKDMQPGMEGKFMCEARNDKERKVFYANVEIFGIEKPVIDKSVNEIRVTEKTNGELSCRILKGIPKPTITWSFQGPGMKKDLTETGETIQLKNAQRDQSGLYICTATNVLGTDNHKTEVIVEYPPQIKSDVKEMKIVDGDEAKLTCDVVGVPAPTVYWTFNSFNVTSTSRTRITADYSLIIKTTVADTGHYACYADNKIGKDERHIFLEVYQKPVIDKSVNEIRVTEKTNGELSCRILKGIPKPSITWSFQGPGINKYLKETGETILLKNAQRDQSGLYICTATNVLGTDIHKTEVIVEYPPYIKSNVKEMKIIDGDEAKLTCDVVGVPAPTVYWTFNSINVTSTSRTRITTDNSLIIKTTLLDIGDYMCYVENKLGKDKSKVFLQVYVPVTIEKPKSNIVETMVGSGTLLNCTADGYPRPDIKWTFSGTLGAPGTDVTSSKHPPLLLLQKLQLKQQGFYMCLAENPISGSANITYEVKVYAPPIIQNVYPSKSFEVINGDKLLRIQCKATGSPKPTITWQKHGLSLAMGTDWFDMEDDGTLLIKDIDRATAGTYMCLAKNSFNTASAYYEVIVRDAPNVLPSKTLYVQEGEMVNIKCEIPHKITDQLRWFKDGKVRIERDEIYLYSATRSDDGVYTCRVSDFLKARSIATKLVVGFKPIFSSEVEETIEFVYESDPALLDCEAHGEPRPTTATWTHDGVATDVTDMTYVLGMELNATGIYECEVSNKFGSIRRSFNVTSRDCILNIKKSFLGKHPILIATSGGWPVYQITDHHMIIPHKANFYMRCPSGFVNPELSLSSNTMAYCERDNIVKIAGKPFNFADVQCNKEVTPNFENTDTKCFGRNTEYVGVGFTVQGYFMEVYRVCFDKVNDVPLFAKYQLSPHHTDIPSSSQWYSSSDTSAEDFEELYNCRRQLYDVSIALGRGLRSVSCCFARRQLVNSRDLLPGISATASFEYKNVVPHWSSCNTKNWDDLEVLVRKLAKKAGRDLIVFTGTSNVRHGKLSVDIKINNGRGRNQTIPPYLWKVVQDPATVSSIAIIQVNIPELTLKEAKKHVLCPDICKNINWLVGPDWHDVDKGYTYCCNIKGFKKAFRYPRPITSMRRLLLDVSSRPETFLLI